MVHMNRSTSKKLLLSLAAVGVAAAIAGLGTFATFTSSTSASQAISSGTVSITLGAAGGTANRLTIGASGLVPGDTIQRRVQLTNPSGDQALASITLTTTATPSNVLTTDATNGLQMKIEKCAGALGWHETVSGSVYTYTCDQSSQGDNAGTRTTVLAQRAIIGTTLSLSSMSALAANNTDDMVVTASLPSTADNTFQTLSSTVTYTFNATQRNGTSQ
jgi:spore coat-associated protein N